MQKIYLLLFFVVLFGFTNAQIILSNAAPNGQENFDGIGSTATAALPTGWKITPAGTSAPTWAAAGNFTATLQQASSGAPTSGSRYNWGKNGTSDRSIGFMTSGGYANPNSIMTEITNNGSTDITAVTIGYDLFRFRINSAAHSVQFFYSTNGSTWVAVAAGDAQAMATGTSAYNFTAPPNFGQSTAAVTAPFAITGISIAPSAKLYLRWNFNTSGSNSAGLGLDNVTIAATYSMASTASITAGALSASPICVTPTTGAMATIAYTSAGTYTGSNWTVYLSDALGSFATETIIGNATVTGTNPAGNINISIPANTPAGTSYKIRIDCEAPAITGNEGGVFTIVNGINNVTALSATPAPTQGTVTWTNPANCYDEIMMVAAPNTILAVPVGDGTAYTANTAFGTGTAFGVGGGFVIYKGTTSPQTITGLTNGTTYFVKIFTRKGTEWSAGVETTVSPVFVAEGLQITSADQAFTIDFDNTAAGINNGRFLGNNINLSNTVGTIISKGISYDANMSATGVAAFANNMGTSGQAFAGTASSGAFYGGTIADGNIGFGIQPASSYFDPGSVTIKVQNKTANPITTLHLGYKIYEYNDQGRSVNFNLYTSATNATGSYTIVPNTAVVTPTAADAMPTLKTNYRSAAITGINIAPEGFYYLRLHAGSSTGSGSRDEVIIDDITVIANPNTEQLSISGTAKTMGINAPVKLTDDMTVTDSAAFNNGVLTCSGFTLTIPEGGKVSGGSVNSYVSGKLSRTGAGVLYYPLGGFTNANRFAPLVFDNLGSLTTFRAEYIPEMFEVRTINAATLTLYPNYSLSLLEHWQIEKTSGAATPNIKFYHQGILSNIPMPADGRIAHYDDVTRWDDIGNDETGTDSYGSFITVYEVTTFSPFTLATINTTILPIAIAQFDASKLTSNSNTINWKANCNTGNNVTFQLQRSVNGVTFNTIETITATTARCQLPFSFIDNYNATSAITYYKLKTTSQTGEVHYSKIAFVNNKGLQAGNLTMYPSLVKNTASVIIESKTNGTVFLNIYDAKGSKIKTINQAVQIGINAFNIETGSLKVGNYFLSGMVNGSLISKSFLKQ